MRDYVFIALIALVSRSRGCALAPTPPPIAQSPEPVTATPAPPPQCENPVGVWLFANGRLWLGEDGRFTSGGVHRWVILQGRWHLVGNEVHLVHPIGPEAALGTWVDDVPTLTTGVKGRRVIDNGMCAYEDDLDDSV